MRVRVVGEMRRYYVTVVCVGCVCVRSVCGGGGVTMKWVYPPVYPQRRVQMTDGVVVFAEGQG